MNDLISIIVPIFNVEIYLERCVQSLLNQSYPVIEILLIDDGSTDKCPKMCDEYEKQYSNIHVIHKRNGGLAEARNYGIEKSKGSYIAFVDSDDFVSEFYVENLYHAIQVTHGSLAVSMFENLPEGDEIKSSAERVVEEAISSCSDVECLKLLLLQKGVETSAPGKLYDKKKIGQLRFPVGRLYEDIIFTTMMISRSSQIAVIDNVDYYYCQRRGSIQYQAFHKQKMDCIEYSRQLNRFIKEKYPTLRNAADSRYFAACCNIIMQIPNYEFRDEKMYIWGEIKKVRKKVIFNKDAGVKTKSAAILSYLGYNALKALYRKTQIRGRYL